MRRPGRMRALFQCLLALAWYFAATFLAGLAARGFLHGPALPLLRHFFQIFLLVLGYSCMALAWGNEREPLSALGLARTSTSARQLAWGAALGWTMSLLVILAVVLGSTFYVRFTGSVAGWVALMLNFVTLLMASLAAEIAFRGYPLRKLAEAVSSLGAVFLAGLMFALHGMRTPGATPASMWVVGMATVVLSVAALRSRTLWMSWGLHAAWLVMIGLLFGQPLAGRRAASSVVQTYVDGPTWLTGSEFGPEASIVSLVLLWVALFLLLRVPLRPPQPPELPQPPALPAPPDPPLL